jgi:acetyl-CoA C-acetyltransferase
MPNKNDIVIVSALRTPFGRYCGSLAEIDYYDLSAIPMREVLKRANVPGGTVGEVFWGVPDTSVCKDPFSPIAARQALIKAGLPHETSSISFDMSGVSAMHAIKLAAMTMKSGETDCTIVGGATSLSRESQNIRGLREKSARPDNIKILDPLQALGYKDFDALAVDCDNVAAEYRIDRVEQDEWSLRSHLNYGKAWSTGKFKEEILSLSITQENGESMNLDIDEQYNPHITTHELAELRTICDTKSITAGNSAGINDGACAILLMTREKAIETGLPPLATVIANISMAINAHRMPEAPGYAAEMVCKKAGLTLDNIDLIEINEDFACTPLASLRIVSGDDKKKLRQLQDMTNINGSAIALGHPVTASGARIVMSLMYELRRRGGGYALGALSGGLAQADACIIKVD